MNDIYIYMPDLVHKYTTNGRRNVDRPRKRWRDIRGVALYPVAVDDDNSFGQPN
jgi:hypothetical protein